MPLGTTAHGFAVDQRVALQGLMDHLPIVGTLVIQNQCLATMGHLMGQLLGHLSQGSLLLSPQTLDIHKEAKGPLCA